MKNKLWISAVAATLIGISAFGFGQSNPPQPSTNLMARIQQNSPPNMQAGQMARPQMGMMRMRPVSAIDLPAGYLRDRLNLSSSQTKKVSAIERTFYMEMKKMHPPMRSGMRGSGNGASPPAGGMSMRGPGMRGSGMGGPSMGGPGNFQKMIEMHNRANDEIVALLTSGQKQILPGVLHQASMIQRAGIPARTLGVLHLTHSQISSIDAIASRREGPRDARADSMAILSNRQRMALHKYMMNHRWQMMPGMGGPGMRGPGKMPGMGGQRNGDSGGK